MSRIPPMFGRIIGGKYDGQHGMQERSGVIALAAGFHPIRVTFFEKTAGDGLKVSWKGLGIEKQALPNAVLFSK